MNIRNNNFRMNFREGVVKDYEKIILTEVNDVFIPMGFVCSNGEETALYNCSGYAALSQCHVTEACEALEILEKTLMQVSRAGEFLIAPAKITLRPDNIFYNRDTKQVRIAYIPLISENPSLQENMSAFISKMSNNVSGSGKMYLEQVKIQMEDNNYYIRDLINVIGEVRRKVISDRRKTEGVEG